MGELGAGAKNQAEVIAPDGKVVAKVTPGATIALPPGIYKLRLPLIGGTISKDDIAIEAGRTHTVLIQNAAVLSVSVKDKDGHDPGFSVTVNQTDAPHTRARDVSLGREAAVRAVDGGCESRCAAAGLRLARGHADSRPSRDAHAR